MTQTIGFFWKCPKVLTIGIAESFVDQVSRRDLGGMSITLDVQDCEIVHPGAGYRIGNVLRRLSEQTNVTAKLRLGEHFRQSSGLGFRVLTRSGLGPAIAAHVRDVQSENKHVGEELRDYYDSTLESPSSTARYFRDIHLGRLDIESESGFAAVLGQTLSGMQTTSYKSFSSAERQSLIALCFEAVQNTFDHASKKPLKPHTEILSYVSIRYYKAIGASEEPSLGAYLRELRKTREEVLSFLEIVVNDDGIGIPARQSLDADIYWSPHDHEKVALEEALSRGSVKLRAGDSKIRGGVAAKGFSRIRDGLKGLNAYASVRTGRSFAAFNGASAREDSFRFHAGRVGLTHGYMPGTALQILVPLKTPSDDLKEAPVQGSLL